MGREGEAGKAGGRKAEKDGRGGGGREEEAGVCVGGCAGGGKVRRMEGEEDERL